MDLENAYLHIPMRPHREVPSICLVDRREVPISVPLFWSQIRPEDFHKGGVRGGGSDAQARNHNVLVPRRLVGCSSRRTGPPGPTLPAAGPCEFTQLEPSHQLGEIRSLPEQVFCVPGGPIRPSGGPPAGHHGLLHRNSALGQATYDTHPALCAVPVEALKQGFECQVDLTTPVQKHLQ